MSDLTEEILDGQFCYRCGAYLGEGDGYPTLCDRCEKEEEEKNDKT